MGLRGCRGKGETRKALTTARNRKHRTPLPRVWTSWRRLTPHALVARSMLTSRRGSGSMKIAANARNSARVPKPTRPGSVKRRCRRAGNATSVTPTACATRTGKPGAVTTSLKQAQNRAQRPHRAPNTPPTGNHPKTVLKTARNEMSHHFEKTNQMHRKCRDLCHRNRPHRVDPARHQQPRPYCHVPGSAWHHHRPARHDSRNPRGAREQAMNHITWKD